METSMEKIKAFIDAGSEIETELREIFDQDEEIHIMDIGACEGLSSIIYSKIFPKAFITAFEMVKENAKKVKYNFEEWGLHRRAIVLNCALSNSDGTTRFYKSSGQAPWVKNWDTGNKSSSLLEPDHHLKVHPWCKFDNIYTSVQEMRLDDLSPNPPDFVHMDVQGAELMVLEGGEKTFSKTRVFWIEVSKIELYKGQALKEDVVKHFLDRGYEVKKDTCKNRMCGDVLFVRD